MGALAKAKKLDDLVLGRSDTTRGFVINAVYGLHPFLAPFWFAGAAVGLVAAILLLASGDAAKALPLILWAAVGGAMGYTSRRLPRRPAGD